MENTGYYLSEVNILDYIVLDIEFNGRKFASELPMEVIEIGAVVSGLGRLFRAAACQ